MQTPLLKQPKQSLYLPWFVCFSGALAFLFVFMQLNMLNTMSQELMVEFQLSKTDLGHLSATYFYAIALAFLPAGLLFDRYPVRRLLLIAIAWSVVGTIIFATATDFTMARVGRFIAGLAHPFAFLGSLRLVMLWLPSRMALVTGLVITIGLSGGMLTQLVMTPLVDYLGWREATLTSVGLGLLIWVILFGFVKKQAVQPINHSSAPSSLWLRIKLVVSNRYNWLCAFYASLLNLPVILLAALWGQLYLTKGDIISRSEAADIIAIMYVGAIISNPLWGWLSDKWQRRKQPMMIGALLSFIIAVTIAFYDNNSQLVLLFLFFVLGLTTSSAVLSYTMIHENNAKQSASTAVGFSSTLIMGTGPFIQPFFLVG